jgi:hypothetical protein
MCPVCITTRVPEATPPLSNEPTTCCWCGVKALTADVVASQDPPFCAGHHGLELADYARAVITEYRLGQLSFGDEPVTDVLISGIDLDTTLAIAIAALEEAL